MTVPAALAVDGSLPVAFAPNYARPCAVPSYQDRTFSIRAWIAASAIVVPITCFMPREALEPTVATHREEPRQRTVVDATTLDVADIIRLFRDGGMPIAALAEIMRVERKTIYAWMDGVDVRSANQARVYVLHRLLSGTIPSHKSLWRVWSRPLSSGFSLRMLLSSEALNEDAIVAALNELHPAVEKYQTRDMTRQPSLSGVNPVISDMPTART